MMATPTTSTRTTSVAPAPSAASCCAAPADFSLDTVVQGYLDCRKNKRNTRSARHFEMRQESHLVQLHEELVAGTYQPGKSVCFVVTRPKAREVWAAPFRDRIPHHILYNYVSPRFLNSFIADSCACIPGRGTLYAAERLEAKIRSATQNWSKPVYYLKCDLANFFVSIDKLVLHKQLAAKITEPWWLALATQILFHDPRQNFRYHGDPKLMNLVPPHKRLASQPWFLGLPIGNLSSQFFANVYLDALDKFCKHTLGVKHYIRYVDDFILLHEDPRQLSKWLAQIDAFLPATLGVRLNPKKTIIQPVSRGVDFVGHVIKPWRRTTRRRTINNAVSAIRFAAQGETFEKTNSYLGLAGQASHSQKDRARISNAARRRGHSVKSDLTKVYRRAA